MKQEFMEGSIVRIDYDGQRHTYAQLITEPWVRVFDFPTDQEIEDIENILQKPELFTIAIHTYGITEGRWPVVGNVPLSPQEKRIPDEFLQDQFDPSNLSIISCLPNGEWSERRASVDECEEIEPASVWDLEHVEQRLAHHYAGTTDLNLLSMQFVRPNQVFTVILTRDSDNSNSWVVSGKTHASLRINSRVAINEHGPALRVTAIKTYANEGELPSLACGQSGTLHLKGEITPIVRSTRMLFKAK